MLKANININVINISHTQFFTGTKQATEVKTKLGQSVWDTQHHFLFDFDTIKFIFYSGCKKYLDT